MIDWPKFYYPGHPIYETISGKSLELVKKGEMTVKNLAGFEKKCRIETFCNKFNHFVLIHPFPRFTLRKEAVILEKSEDLTQNIPTF